MDKLRIDGTKIMFHPQRVAELLEGADDWNRAKFIYPIYIEVSPIGACNHRCTFCAVDYIGYQSTRLDHNIYADRIWEMGSCGVKSVMFAGEGEPLLNKHINEMVEATLNAGVDVSFTTNGVLLDRLHPIDKISWIKVSMNAGTRETYAKVHRTQPVDFDRVVANLRAAVARKGDCQIGAQMVLLPENQHEVEQFRALCADIGLDYAVIKPYSQHKSSITHEYEKFIPIVPEGDARLIVRTKAIETHDIPYDKCLSTPFIWAYIMASGDMYSCSAYLLDDRFMLGNINTQSFREIWHGAKRKANWEYVREHLDIKECRTNCRMNQSNIYLDEVTNGKVKNVNFI